MLATLHRWRSGPGQGSTSIAVGEAKGQSPLSQRGTRPAELLCTVAVRSSQLRSSPGSEALEAAQQTGVDKVCHREELVQVVLHRSARLRHEIHHDA